MTKSVSSFPNLRGQDCRDVCVKPVVGMNQVAVNMFMVSIDIDYESIPAVITELRDCNTALMSHRNKVLTSEPFTKDFADLHFTAFKCAGVL